MFVECRKFLEGTANYGELFWHTDSWSQPSWQKLTPVICPPASISWVWGMVVCTEGCWEGWLGCWESPDSSLDLDLGGVGEETKYFNSWLQEILLSFYILRMIWNGGVGFWLTECWSGRPGPTLGCLCLRRSSGSWAQCLLMLTVVTSGDNSSSWVLPPTCEIWLELCLPASALWYFNKHLENNP